MTTLDTSGVVRADIPGMISPVSWQDPSPFAQGYVEALFESLPAGGALWSVDNDQWILVGFSDLTPEALAMILRDCEAMHASKLSNDPGAARHNGRRSWELRQAGKLPAFPPLRVYLNDAGKVMLEVAK